MTNDGEPSQPRGTSLELAYEKRRDKDIIDLYEQVRKLTMELERVKEYERWVPWHRELDVNPIDVAYSSSHDDLDDRGNWARDRPRGDLSDPKVEALEFTTLIG